MMMPKKSLMSHTVLAHSKQHLHNKKRRPRREYRCGAGQIPFEGQVRISHNSKVLKQGQLCVPWFVKVLGFFYSSKGLTSLPWCRVLFLIRIFMSVFFGTISL